MSGNLFAAVGLMLVLEGLLPFVAPALWRETFKKMTELSDGQVRFIGLGSIMLGILVFALLQ
jgi:uncharacterized protein